MRIIRHQIAITDYQEIDLPASGKALSVAMSRIPELQNHALDLWSADYESGPPKTLAIYVVGTGNPMPDGINPDWFIGTVVTPSGLVWHAFQGLINR
ncbi:DUF7352 domain-containing protein [Mycolicibacterium fluoranthenivorans]|uniref:DUF7352 domain-containing protein n=1 Tax=Mycolicibacterium fluoranthenivorans TaxID=258505 RepID=A0A7X5ZG57_9MYCO|nr:hypothetical protein [Mycolicibacterium fluoranthenivorans]MCV7354473.1 hypothetical protein [Mycolicibacterium fluoranthenivorans]NIH98924.1 hypothetical protein [Mycolicibacterium fluoranthenivorans]